MEPWRGDTVSHKAAGLEILRSQSSSSKAVGGDEQLCCGEGGCRPGVSTSPSALFPLLTVRQAHTDEVKAFLPGI